MTVNHVGLRVSDLAVSVRFYEALGFRETMALDVPDVPADRLLQIEAPVGLRAVYLTSGPFVLELLGFSAHPAPPVDRAMTDTGLTHLSLGVDDIERAKSLVREHGGRVLTDTDLGVAVMVRDPDGQLIELLEAARRPVTPPDRTALEVIGTQRACRSFLPDGVPDADLAALIEAASHAPSAENSQPWVFVVVDDADVRAAVDELTRSLWRRQGRPHSEKTLSPSFFDEVDQFLDTGYGGAPCLVVVCGDRRDATPRELLAASVFPATQNLLLAASALGYGSSMTTLAPLARDDLASILGLPDTLVPFAVVPIGRSSRPLGPPRRRPVEEIAHRNRFGVPFR